MRLSVPRPGAGAHRPDHLRRLAATVRLAQTADRLGFTRYWLAEHHNMPARPPPTRRCSSRCWPAGPEHIRLGSGGVMLPNHALAVAEQFALLEAAAPGASTSARPRTRLGPGDVGDAERDREAVANFPRYLDEIAAMMSAGGVQVELPARLGRTDYVLRPRPRRVSRGCGCWVRRCTPRTWPPPRACRTCSRTTSRARGPRRPRPSTATSSGPATCSPSRSPS